MPSVSSYEGMQVLSAADKPLGKVAHVLFHPSKPLAVGVEVVVPRLGYVVDRPRRYLPLAGLEREDGFLRYGGKKLPSRASSEKTLGLSWDETVIWVGQQVMTESGSPLGYVRDVVVSARGEVRKLKLSGGMTADAAIGRQEVIAEDVLGFDGKVVRVRDVAEREGLSGGLAAAAGKGSAYAKVGAERLAASAAAAGVTIAKTVRDSGVADKAKGALRSLGRIVKQATKPEDDD